MLVRNQITQLAKLYNNTLCHNPPPHAVVSLLVVKQEIILVELAADLYCFHQQDLYKTCIAVTTSPAVSPPGLPDLLLLLAHHFPLFHYLLLFDLTPLQSTMSKMNIGLNEMLSLQQTMMLRRPMFSK